MGEHLPSFDGIAVSVHRGLQDGTLNRNQTQPDLWELNELLFRYELLAMDRRLTKVEVGQTPYHEVRRRREHLVVQCFYGGKTGKTGILFVNPAYARVGLADPFWAARRSYTKALWTVIRDWNVKLPFAITLANVDWEKLNEGQFTDLEMTLWEFYIQTFYDSFSRPPTVPRTLPEDVVKAIDAAQTESRA